MSDSPSCIVADENDPTAQMQEMMRSMGQMDMPDIKPILEINPEHDIVVKLKSKTKQKKSCKSRKARKKTRKQIQIF